MRRVFKLVEVRDFTELQKGDHFVMYEGNDGEPVRGGQAAEVITVHYNGAVAMQPVMFVGEYGRPPLNLSL